MRCVVKAALFAFVLLANSPVWAGGNVWQTSPKPANTAWYRTAVTPTVNGAPIALPSVRNLPPDIDRPRVQGLLSKTTWLKGAFATEAEVAAHQGSASGEDPSARMVRLGLNGSIGVIRYGMSYLTADQAFLQGAGQGQREAWAEWKHGAMALRSTFGQRTNPQPNTGGNRPEQTFNRIDVTWSRPAWPYLGFSYVHNAASHTMDALSLFPQRATHDRVEAAVGLSGAIWDAKLISGFGTETDLTQHAADSRVQTETLTVSFRPADILSITPTVGYRVEQQPWSGARINAPSASISMSYIQSRRLTMTAMGNYFSMRSSDRLIDFDMIGGKGVLTWELEPVRDWKPRLSVEGGYNLQVNRLLPSSQTENLSGLLRLVLATM
jgi:hypothetical protein